MNIAAFFFVFLEKLADKLSVYNWHLLSMQVQSLHDTIRQLEEERTQLYENLKEQRQLSDNMGIKIADLQEEVIWKSEYKHGFGAGGSCLLILDEMGE